MNNLTNTRVKDLFFTDGYFHIDLFDGMRLSGPIRNNGGGTGGTSRLVETGPSNDWDADMSLDHLISPPAA